MMMESTNDQGDGMSNSTERYDHWITVRGYQRDRTISLKFGRQEIIALADGESMEDPNRPGKLIRGPLKIAYAIYEDGGEEVTELA